MPSIVSPETLKKKPNQPFSFLERRRRRKAKEEYYNNLNELEEHYESDRKIIEGITEQAESEAGMDKILSNLSMCLNITLLFTNLLASYLSGSLSIISTFVDSLMDVTSGLIISICLRLIANSSPFNYPRGRTRLELIGVLLCSVIMGIANTILVMESIRSIIDGDIKPVMDLLTLIIMLGGSAIKIILCIVCYRHGSNSSIVLAMDMRNDIATSLVAVVCATLGHQVWPYADPIGAIIVCGVIATTWFYHALENVPHLTGKAAERDYFSRILKIVIEHDEKIKYVDHVLVYHTNTEVLAEVHIVLDEHLPLRITHDISQSLEQKLGMLDFVERCFVHCDFELDGDH